MSTIPTILPRRRTALRILVVGIFFITLAGSPSVSQVPAAPGTTPADLEEPLATIDGAPLTRTQVEEAAAEAWEKVEMERLQCQARADQAHHQVLEQTVERLIQQQLLEAAAAADGGTFDSWFPEQTKKYAEGVSDEEVDLWYRANQGRIRQSKEQVAAQIKNLLANQKLVSELKAKHDIRYQIEPYRVEVEATGPAKGPATAPVTIVEFSDFECPYCKRLNPTLAKVRAEYGEDVRLVFRQFPLVAIHPRAQKAAEAALCANEQDRFWQMHDLLFGDQKLELEDLRAKALELELDMEKFNACLDSGSAEEAVRKDMFDAVRAGVSGTPALFVNGRFLSGAVPYEEISAVIDDELKRQGEERP